MSRVLGDLRVSRAPRGHPCVSTWAQGDVGVHQDCVLVAVGDLADSGGTRILASRVGPKLIRFDADEVERALIGAQ